MVYVTPTHAYPKVQVQCSKVCRTPAHQVTFCHLALLAGLVLADDLRFPRRPAPTCHSYLSPVMHVRASVHSVKGQEHCACACVSVYSSMHAWGEGERREEGGAKGTGRRVYAARSHPAQILAGNTRICTCISICTHSDNTSYTHFFIPRADSCGQYERGTLRLHAPSSGALSPPAPPAAPRFPVVKMQTIRPKSPKCVQ
jgi:hypothetical protein